MTRSIFHLQAWTPDLSKIAQQLIREIHSIAPELEVLFMGAAALKLPGKNDIDLDILCDEKRIHEYTNKLAMIFGKPRSADGTMTIWSFDRNNFEVDMILSDPKTSHVPQQLKVFEALRNNKALLNEYKTLKIAADGLPYHEYEAQKIQFFKEKRLQS